MLVYDKYIESRKKLSFFKSVQVVEELPNQYMLIISNSPVKKMFSVKWNLYQSEDFIMTINILIMF